MSNPDYPKNHLKPAEGHLLIIFGIADSKSHSYIIDKDGNKLNMMFGYNSPGDMDRALTNLNALGLDITVETKSEESDHRLFISGTFNLEEISSSNIDYQEKPNILEFIDPETDTVQ